MRQIERVPKKQQPRLFDKLIQELQDGLAARLLWLDHSFGKAERLVIDVKGRKHFTPNIYLGKNEYLPISPDSGLGNYSFFILEEPQRTEYAPGDRTAIKTPFSLVVWVDMRTIEDADERNTEAIKQQVLRALNGGILTREGKITINKIYERAENVFNGFSLDEIKNQFLMQPFAGFRFAGEMEIKDDCEL